MIKRASSSRGRHLGLHAPDTLVQPDEDRLADQEMADVQLDHLRDGGDRLDVVERQPVAGVDLDPVLGGERGGVA